MYGTGRYNCKVIFLNFLFQTEKWDEQRENGVFPAKI